MAKHRTSFSTVEWLALRVLVAHLDGADEDDQKQLRDGLRGLGFYISDFPSSGTRFTLEDLQGLLDAGLVKIVG